ncbi:GNAT family N-acetyltransferase [Paenibacillus sp. OAS669]|uniref:GNAT family N-acetyltransferase n=1 Tax=Paenibacillus sp. OAS669 TaxID=2663821 RepID=UPI00178B9140|nr:GNAT family N-acetyltransferase [Paenibacillus sp. OAS669]MBE1446203.1 GNAT superfamily N-acetyltransferase [Paenibacillus sp. OAS669]
MDIVIRPMLWNDLEAVGQLRPKGWGDIAPQMLYYWNDPSCMTFVAERGDRIVGMANATCWGPTGWLGPIIVEPSSRGLGLGSRLTRTVMDDLHSKGCRTLQLIATEFGKPVYEKLGFTVESRYCFLKAEPEAVMEEAAGSGQLRAVQAADLPMIAELDRRAAGENRMTVLEKLLQHNGGWVVPKEDGSGIRGYYLHGAPWSPGPIVASDVEAGRMLLQQAVISEKHHSIGVSELNTKAIDYLQQIGLTIASCADRMVLGERSAWRPDMIYSRISGSLG